MVKFTSNSVVIALVDDPVWIYMQSNGCYGRCKHIDAEGAVVGGVVYNLPGRCVSKDADEINYEFIETGAYIMQKNIETEQMLTDLDIANIEAQQAITELELMILEG